MPFLTQTLYHITIEKAIAVLNKLHTLTKLSSTQHNAVRADKYITLTQLEFVVKKQKSEQQGNVQQEKQQAR